MTVAISVTTDSAWPPRNVISATGFTIGDVITIYRVVGGIRTPLRGATAVTLTDPAFVIYDGEYGFGVPTTYIAAANGDDSTGSLMGAVDGTYESGVTGWTATSCTFVSSTTHVHGGAKAALLTVTGSPTIAKVRATTSVNPGASVTFGQQFFHATSAYAGHATVSIDWYDINGVLLSTTTAPTASLVANTWALVSLTTTVPLGAVTAKYGPALVASPATGAAVWVDFDVTAAFTVTPATTLSTVYTLPGGKVVLSDAITGLAAEVVIMSWPDKVNARSGTEFTVGGRTAGVYDPRGGAKSTIEFMTETETSRQQMIALLDGVTSGIVLMRQPGGYYGVDGWYLIASDDEGRASQNGLLERRFWTVDMTEVDPWAPELLATGSTYTDLVNTYSGLTYTDLVADFVGETYLDFALMDWS